MTKSKKSMAARGITYLAGNTLPVVVLESVFLFLGRYLLSRVIDTKPETTSRNVSIASYGLSLVTILLLGFCLDSLNLLNLGKIIKGKLNYLWTETSNLMSI